MHWGREYLPQVNSLQRKAAQHLTSLGVQLVIGCHPHVEQPYSYQGNRFVSYSLGNLVFLHSLTPGNLLVSRNSYCLCQLSDFKLNNKIHHVTYGS